MAFAPLRIASLALCSFVAVVTLCSTGCEETKTAAEIAKDRADPEGEFEWGMERLKRALRDFSPSGADGVKVTDRKVEHKFFPPDKEHPNYRARVTITTETAFLHDKRGPKEAEAEPKEDEEPKIDDPLNDPEDEYSKVLDGAGTGPAGGNKPAVAIEPRILESETVFELAYLDGKWKLTKQPEKKHEQLWFEYAFD